MNRYFLILLLAPVCFIATAANVIESSKDTRRLSRVVIVQPGQGTVIRGPVVRPPPSVMPAPAPAFNPRNVRALPK